MKHASDSGHVRIRNTVTKNTCVMLGQFMIMARSPGGNN